MQCHELMESLPGEYRPEDGVQISPRLVIDTDDGHYFAVSKVYVDDDGDFVIVVGEEL